MHEKRGGQVLLFLSACLAVGVIACSSSSGGSSALQDQTDSIGCNTGGSEGGDGCNCFSGAATPSPAGACAASKYPAGTICCAAANYPAGKLAGCACDAPPVCQTDSSSNTCTCGFLLPVINGPPDVTSCSPPSGGECCMQTQGAQTICVCGASNVGECITGTTVQSCTAASFVKTACPAGQTQVDACN